MIILPPTSLISSSNHWLSQSELNRLPVNASTKRALQFRGLLTAAIAEISGNKCRLDALDCSPTADDDGSGLLRRDVVIRADQDVCVVASTLMPDNVVCANPWLGSLGTRPLGETLQQRTNAYRGPFEFLFIDSECSLGGNFPSNQPTWARRYPFLLGEGALTVMEIFSPEFLDKLGAVVDSLHL